MNIIELFDELKIDKSNILLFSTEDIKRVEKQVNAEKRINTEIDSKTSENLITVLKEYKEELLFVMSNHILFNFFTHNNFSKNDFSNYNLTVSDEKIKGFISLFLADDLISFFSFKLSKNTYDNLQELNLLLDLKSYFPEEIIYKMASLVFSKLDFAVSQLSVSTTSDFSNIGYIKYSTFYDLLSHFATVELDRKMDNLLLLVVRSYKKNPSNIFFISVIKSMAFYNAFNEKMTKTLVNNKDLLLASIKDNENENDSEKVYRVIQIVLVVIFLLVVLNKSACH
ncbi:hypothetical protein IRZ71_24560 [Flavobacterium sp. ANB]|uniref:hypothetical protein n=1 Tax=unclassified Flavobacterium TaxID=196869 RepID=UPI0012B998AD|nr:MULTISPECIES: hypothetical protein [unclassified Flavobacterium]MBF4519524.1 hypothetical protein [Flavobacterium sp. ANB]MTD72394.1 hypothetical protein [Flavobacterium sp. LC2016-13]